MTTPDNLPPEVALKVLQEKDADLLRWMDQISVTSIGEQKNCESNLIMAKNAYNQAEAMRKNLTAPMYEAIKRINALFKPYTSKLELGINMSIKGLSDWHAFSKKEAGRKLDTLAVDYMNKVKEAQETGEIVPVPRLPDLNIAKTSHSGPGYVSYIDGFEIIIISEDKVPRDLCKADMSKIRARVKSGGRQIDGVSITQKYNLRSKMG